MSTLEVAAGLPRNCSERLLAADSVEKRLFASAEYWGSWLAQMPFLSGFSRLLRCGKYLGQLPEVLGGGGEEKFVVFAAWTT